MAGQRRVETRILDAKNRLLLAQCDLRRAVTAVERAEKELKKTRRAKTRAEERVTKWSTRLEECRAEECALRRTGGAKDYGATS